MNVLQYLQKKYSMAVPTAITNAEAKIFGIPTPLTRGWLAKHGSTEITPEMNRKLISAMEKRGKHKSQKTKRLAKAGVDALIGKSGPVTIIKANMPRNISVTKAPAQYRGPYIDPNSDEFLQSYQWRTLRFDVIAKYGNACQCCGATPNAKQGIAINVDHIYPRRTHPHLALDMSNLQILCNVCNHGKSNRHAIDFRPSEESDGLEEYSDESISERLRNF
jgi:5-methylcytosine-specific restriction endonuclease McrA